MLQRIISNHVLANLSFGLVLVLGYLAFDSMPRARDPEIVFNYVNIVTTLPGASSSEIEKRITDPIEERIASSIKDIKFVQSSSREGVSSITMRFEEIPSDLFKERLQKLRREVQNVYNQQLPEEANDPEIESMGTTSFPAAYLVAKTDRYDEDFRRYLSNTQKIIERLPGIDSAEVSGSSDPELHVSFYPDRLVGLGLTPADLADTMANYFRDLSVGDLESETGKLVIRLEGTSGSLEDIRAFPIISSQGTVSLGDLADVYFSSAESSSLVLHQSSPAVLLAIMRQTGGNELAILEELRQFIETENQLQKGNNVEWLIVDDQTITTREAINMMQSNALIGLALVVLVSYLFLGGRIAFLTTIGIPFTLAGTFIILDGMGRTVNNTSLLGVVVALGMIVDDAVVVVEAIYYRLQRGMQVFEAAASALQEVSAPVLTSILTTISVFMPLVFLPGILGNFLAELPIVVCLALAISLIEAFWILPAHISFLKVQVSSESSAQRVRTRLTHKVRIAYSRLLVLTFRKPLTAVGVTILPPLLAVGLLMGGAVNIQFFPEEPFRIYYINAELPPQTTLQDTLDTVVDIEQIALMTLEEGELQQSVAYAGQKFTETSPEFGENIGQAYLTFKPNKRGMRSIHEIFDGIKQAVGTEYKGADISYTEIIEGPPLGAPVSMKFLGSSFEVLQDAVAQVKSMMDADPRFNNISDTYQAGAPTMLVKLDGDAIKRAGLHPTVVTRSLSSFVDGELIAQYQRLGEEVDIRLLASEGSFSSDQLLQQTIANAFGEEVALGSLLDVEYKNETRDAKHFNFYRSIEVTSYLDLEAIDVVSANELLLEYWEGIRSNYPDIRIDTSGQFDDLMDTLDSIGFFFTMGMGLIYLILGTQFKSYLQPLIVLLSVPLAFTGVIYGLVVTGSPMTFYTMYGVVALSGIAVNSAIVMVSAANQRMEKGMSVLHATIYASRRRVIPVLITTFTTIGGLFSMAAGLAGVSLVWGPLAVAIVSGLFFSTPLILLIIPHLYRFIKISPFANV